MKRHGEGSESPNKKPKIDDIERLKAEIARKLAAATSAPSDGLSEVQRKIQLAKQEAQKRKAASLADNILQEEVEKVHDEQIKAKGGLNVAYHPALAMNIDPKARVKNRQAQFIPNIHATSLANQKLAATLAPQKPALVKKKEIKLTEQFEDPTKSKYYDPNLQTTSGYQPKPRSSRRGFKFVEPGQYITLANEQRKQEQLEALKREIAEAARKAGMERELELVANAGIRNQAPPAIEWWDAKFVTNESYEGFDPNQGALNELINNIVQHPVPIEPPTEEGVTIAPRPLILTKQERKKLRRQNRLEAQREKQDMIRGGLLPEEQPKITKANFMRVLGQEAISAPSMVEAEMARQVKERQQKHKELIESQKLTEEERKAKKDRKLREDTSILCKVAVFRIDNLEHRQQLFKVNTNAQQYKLTGVGIISDSMNLVVVEGGPKGINAYKKIMLNRINWQSRPEGAEPFKEPNKCLLIWEGEVKTRSFKNFKLKTIPNSLEAKAYLETMNAAQYWNIAAKHVNDAF